MTASQLTIDGREEDGPAVTTRSAPFTRAQQEILRLLAERDITSSDAGRIMHAYRSPPCRHCELGRCPWTSSDGRDALMRLQERGFVHRVSTGVWRAQR